MLKYATAQVMSKILIPQDAGRRELRRLAHRHDFKYQVRPGYLYVRSRAISSRCNDNFDEFPAEELAKAYASFKGKPVFVNHVNHDHTRARGVIIDAALHKDANRDGSKDWWVEVLMEVDALRFPRLAAEIMNGNIARTSMGCDVTYSVCSACGNKATTPAEYCKHIPGSKGQRLYRAEGSTGRKIGELIRETCYGLKFFENSLLVEPPADPTAHFLGVDSRGLDKAASKPQDPFLYAAAARIPHQVRRESPVGRADSYPSLEEIPQSEVDRTAATGSRKTASRGYSWGQIGEMHPRVYGGASGDGEGIGSAANYLAHDREDDPEAEGSDVGEMSFHFMRVKPHEIDHARHEGYDPRVNRAAQGYRENPEQVPPLVLVHRHGVYQVADGHHRAEGAKKAGVSSVPAYVAYSPHENEPFSDGSSAPFHGARQSPETPPGRRQKDPSGPGFEQQRLFEATRKLAYGETKAPQDVDTLREDACPVCGDRDTFDGATCQVCGYVAPPQMFQDPDLEVARQMDLRKDIAEFTGQPGEPVDPDTLDENGNPVPGAGGPQVQQPGTLPGEVQAEVQPGGDPMDPNALGADGQIPDEMGEPVDPSLLGPDGQPLDPQTQQPMLGPDGMPVGPQELPSAAISGDGKPFHPGPNMPEGPGGPEDPEQPEGPMGPDELDEDGQIPNPDAGQEAPGTPGDGVPDLTCPECGFSADATQPTSIDMDTAGIPDDGMATPDGIQAGDVCPNCGQGLLMSPAEMQGQVPPAVPGGLSAQNV